MKLTMKQIAEGEDEVIIRYRQMNDEVESIASIVQSSGKRIEAYEDGRQLFLLPEQIYYCQIHTPAKFFHSASGIVAAGIQL